MFQTYSPNVDVRPQTQKNRRVCDFVVLIIDRESREREHPRTDDFDSGRPEIERRIVLINVRIVFVVGCRK